MFENKDKILKKNWCSKAGELLSEQLISTYQAIYFYVECYTFFSCRKIALKGLGCFYKKRYKTKLSQAQDILDFMIKRGFEVIFKPINTQKFDEFQKPCDIIQFTKKYEEDVLANLNYIASYAEKKGEITVFNFLEDLIKFQVDEIYELDCLYKNAVRCKEEQALFMFDKSLL